MTLPIRVYTTCWCLVLLSNPYVVNTNAVGREDCKGDTCTESSRPGGFQSNGEDLFPVHLLERHSVEKPHRVVSAQEAGVDKDRIKDASERIKEERPKADRGELLTDGGEKGTIQSFEADATLHHEADIDMYDFDIHDFTKDGAWRDYAWACKYPKKLPEAPPRTSPAVFPYGRYKSIFYQHPRKAGGTTLAFWLACVAQYHNMTFRTEENFMFDPDRLDNEPDTFFVTSLRDPISRILSSYNYEGRWKVLERDRTTANAVPFREWVQASIGSNPPCKKNQTRRFCNTHTTSSEYYVKVFGGMLPGDQHKELIMREENVQLAERVLMRFNKVIKMQEFKGALDEPYQLRLQEAFNIKLPIIRMSAWGAGGQQPEAYTITENELEMLRDLNRRDIELYHRLMKVLPNA